MIKCITELLPNKNTPIYVGVSMGVDSIAAYFHLKRNGYDVIPLHFNHGLRDQNNGMENKFRELFNIPNGYFSDYVEKMGIVGHGNNLTSENDCRKARIEFFKQHVEGSILITGHHLDDYVESYLLNCFRGQPEYRPFKLVSDFVSFKIVHPFLLTEKKDMIQFVDKYDGGRLKKYVVQDETNSVIKGSRRNWIRNNIIPSMEEQKISLKKYCKGLIEKDIEQFNQ